MTKGCARPTLARKAVAGLGALVATLAFLPATGAPAAEAPALFEQVGTFERFPADARAALGEAFVPLPGKETALQKRYAGTIIAVPQSRLLVQIFPERSAGPVTMLAVRDLDTMLILRTVRLPAGLRRATTSSDGAGDWAHAVDDTGTRLWLVQADSTSLFEVDLRTGGFRSRPLPASVLGLSSAYPNRVGGLTYDPWTDDLLLLYGGPATLLVANANAFLYRLDVSGAPPTSFDPAHTAEMYRVRSCTGPVTSTDSGADTSNWDMLVTEEFLYVPCQRAGHTVVVVRMRRPDPTRPQSYPNHEEDVTAGPVYGSSVLADQASGRLFVTTIRREIWVFETATMSFVGVVATGPDNTELNTGFGMDPMTGRVFFQSPTFGLGVVEGRFFPIPQARTMPRRTTGQERIWSDAATNRVFVLEGDGLQGKPTAYRVYRTPSAPVPPAPPDPDRNTADVAEREGVTEARFNASVSGYGTRVLLAKGIAAVPPAPVLGVNAPTSDVLTGANAKCSFTDRDLFAGRVAKAEYDTGSTAAKAVAVAVDGNTEQDLNQPSRCNLPAGLTNWDHAAAECASNEVNMPKGPVDGGHKTAPDLGPSTVTCRAPGRPLDAYAESKLKLGGDPTNGNIVQVDRSFTTTNVERNAAGVVATVESVAQGISIGGQIHIGEVRSKAVSTSNGRPKRKDMSTHEITIADVRVGDVSLCGQSLCRDPLQLERDLNLLAGGRAVFRTGHGSNSGRDETLLEGSRRGAQTAVQKSVARQASDRALIGDFTVEVPAFEVTVFNDNTKWGRARQLYQFAGVASSATYNIVVNPTGAGLDADTGLPADVAVADRGSTPFPDLVEQFDGIGTDAGFDLGPTAPTVDRRLPGVEDDESGPAAFLRAVARGLRLFLTSPRTALLLLTAWALLGSPAVLSRRRRLLEGVRTA